MILSIASGKGGTGKTSLIASFASLAESKVLCDADVERVVQLTNHFKVPAMVCINKFDLNLDLTRDIENFARDESLICLGRIPFDPIFTRAMIQGQTIFEYNSNSSAGEAVKRIWNTLSKSLNL
jgi:MinD superfamily P-loop ATPase